MSEDIEKLNYVGDNMRSLLKNMVLNGEYESRLQLIEDTFGDEKAVNTAYSSIDSMIHRGWVEIVSDPQSEAPSGCGVISITHKGLKASRELGIFAGIGTENPEEQIQRIKEEGDPYDI